MSTQPYPPHILFRELTDIMDGLRRDSAFAISSSQQKKMFGLTVRQSSAISRLKMLMETQPQGVALKVLAKQMQMTVPAASLLVETMVGKGFFERAQNPNDRRAVCIRLSEKGLALFADVYARFHAAIDARAASLTEEELRTLATIVTKIRSAKPAEGKI